MSYAYTILADVLSAKGDKDGAIGLYNALGGVLYLKGDKDRAIENYQKAIELDPKHETAYRNMASVLLDLQRFEEADEKLAKARELSSQR